MEDDYDSFEDDSPGGQALHVDEDDDDDFDLDLPPTTGNEYLRRVRYVHCSDRCNQIFDATFP